MKSRLLCIEPLESRIAPAFAAVFELSSLNGLNGFKINGAAAHDDSGRVSDAGDVNGVAQLDRASASEAGTRKFSHKREILWDQAPMRLREAIRVCY